MGSELLKPVNKLINVFLYFAYREPNHTIDTQKAFYLIWAADRKQLRYSGSPLVATDFEVIEGYNIVPTILTSRLDEINDSIKAHNGEYEVLNDYNPILFSETNRRILKETYEYFHDWDTAKFVEYFKKFPEYISGTGKIDKRLFFKDNDKGFFEDDQEALDLTYEMFLERYRV